MKKVLIVTYYWPPAGGPGVQRWLKFVKYLPEFGIEPIVYVPENPTYPIIDESLLEEVSKNTKIISQPIFEPYGLAKYFSRKKVKTMSSGLISEGKKQSFIEKSLLFIRGNFFIPDARKFWVKPSVKFLSKFISSENIDTIITTGPPHSLHLIGLELKKKKNEKLRWIADFRDPWTTIGYQEKLLLTKSSDEKHRKLETDVLQSADLIVTTSFSTRKEFQEKTKKPVETITNGFDDLELKNEIPLDEKFTFSHIGSLLSGRNPENLWKAFSELLQENSAFKKAFKLRLIGKVSSDVLHSLNDFGLEKYLDLFGYVSHEKAMEFQQKSQVLLLLEIDSQITQGIIPGKLFEYMRSNRPILAIGPKNWDAAKIISETSTGKFFGYDEKEKIKHQIQNYFLEFLKGSLRTNPQGIEVYSRRELTKKLSEIIFK
ncbi:MAG TPA: glycosyl transferase family 1 [Flavobacteriaceae bacterium]|nr:glycosyl transferase family 1 [Flavobacteriaceae bacterium]